MKLLKLSLTNFQGIKSLSFDFLGGQSATIYGDNATGKTTVYNAVTWLLFDKASTAVKNYTPKTKGTDGDIHNLEHSSEAVFQLDSGRVVTLKKIFKEIYKKKRGSVHEEFDGHTTEYYVDDVPVKEKDFSENVLIFCGGDREKPKMLTMPDYFSEQISWEARRKILLDICGDISDSEIIEGNEALNELPDFLRIVGTTEQYHTPDEFQKMAKAKKAEINKQLESIPSRIDEAERAVPDTTGLYTEDIKRTIEILSKKLDELTLKKSTMFTNGTATAELQSKIAEIKTKLAEGKAQHIKVQSEKNSDIDADIILAKRDVSEAKRKIEDIKEDIRRAETRYRGLNKLRDELLAEYEKVSNERWDETQTVCPTCHQSLPTEEIEKMLEEFNLNKSKKLENINQRGKTEASKTEITELEKRISTLKIDLETTEQKKRDLESIVAELETRRVPLVPYETTEEYASFTTEIAKLEIKIADEVNCKSEAVDAVEREIMAVKEAIRAEQDKQMRLSLAEQQYKRIAELEETEKHLAAEFEELEKGIYLCEVFIKTKVSALNDRINEKFKNVRFRLFQEQINGGLKEDCEVMIPTADGRMVPYSFANNAARINAGLEIIGILSEHWGLKMPVFVDNAESVTKLLETNTQTIRLVVSESDKALRIEIK